MTFARIWPAGIGDAVPVSGANFTTLDLNISRAVDGYNGGEVQPLAPIHIAGAGLKVSGPLDLQASSFPLGAFNRQGPQSFTTAGAFTDLASEGGVVLAVGGTDLVSRSLDSGLSWADFSPGTPATVVMGCVAMKGDGKAVASGSKGAGTVIYHTTDNGGTWTNATNPGAAGATFLSAALYDPDSDRFVMTGGDGVGPVILTCEASNLAVWTERTVPASITGTGAAISLVKLASGRILATWQAQTRIAYSDDGGATWAVGDALTSGWYTLAVGKDYVVAYADGAVANRYRSADGATWSNTGMANCPITGVNRNTFTCWLNVFLLHSGPSLFYSADSGATWASVSDASTRTLSLIRSAASRFWVTRFSGGASYIERSWIPHLPG